MDGSAGGYGPTVYDYVESWWGEELTDRLAERIAAAPLAHLEAFEEQWPRPRFFSDDHSLPALHTGYLRPAFGGKALGRDDGGSLQRALRSLLLAPSAVVDVVYVQPFRWLNDGWDSQLTSRYDFDDWEDEMRRRLPGLLGLMRQIRPLIEDGSLLLTPMSLDRRDHALFASVMAITEAAESELEAIPTVEWPEDPETSDISHLTIVARRLALPVELARAGLATVAATSPDHGELLAHLLTRQFSDRRESRVETLIRLDIPLLTADLADLANIRRHESAYRELRTALAAALDDVSALDESADLALARDVVRAGVHDRLAAVEKAVRASPALTAWREGSTRVAVSTIGLAAGIGVGAVASPTAGLASGLAAAGTGALLKYLETIRARRSNRLLWDIVMGIFD